MRLVITLWMEGMCSTTILSHLLLLNICHSGKPFAEGALRHAFNAEAIGTITPADEKEHPLATELYVSSHSIHANI